MYHKANINEAEYKIMRLKEIIPKLKKKHIVIYGVGVNAKRALACMSSLHILGLMDDEYTGKYLYGKKVLSQEEVLLLNVDTILIAATPEATQIVYKRIVSFCMDHHISILNMYGGDECLFHKRILEQEIEYPNVDEESLKSDINANKAIIISLKDVICSELVSDEKLLFQKMEKKLEKDGSSFHNFASKRILAEKKVSCGVSISRKEVYEMLSTMSCADEKQLEYIKGIEEELILENFIPRIKMIHLLEYAINQGKDVYIYSDVLEGEEIIDAFFKPYGISKYKKIVATSEMLTYVLGTTIRMLGEQYGYDHVLYLDTNESINLIIPQLYNVNFQLIQSSLDAFLKTTELKIDQDMMECLPYGKEIIKSILETYNTPFLKQIDSASFDKIIAERIGWSGEAGQIDTESLPVKLFGTTDETDKISFLKGEKPQVSIIISVYNQFEYIYNCLKAISLNTDMVAYEVILVDNGYFDLITKLEGFISGIKVIHCDKNRKYIDNCNEAVKIAEGTYLVFLNDNIQVQVNWLYSLIKCNEIKKDVGIVGAKFVHQNGSLQEAGQIVWSNGNICRYGENKKPDAPEYCYVREVDSVSSAAMMIKKELWDDIGGFEKGYTSGKYRDADLAYEVRRRGKRVLYQPDFFVVQSKGIYDYKDTKEQMAWEYDRNRFLDKWKSEIQENQNKERQGILSVSERKQNRKMVLFVSGNVPTFDKDAGSRTIDFYMQEFLNRDYIVKLLPANFIRNEPYTYRLEQMGVEVLGGGYYKKTILNWICSNHRDIDYVFLNYPNPSIKFIDIFKKFGIPVMYYGVDLHYLRLQREQELFGNKIKAEQAKLLYEKEAYLIKNSDAVYYPSLVETAIVEKEFHRSDAKQLLINIYDTENIRNTYKPSERAGIMFLGSYRHRPNVDAVQWFSLRIFPQIYSMLKIPFYIAGSNMPKDLMGTDKEGIKVLGTLTDSELEEMYNTVKMIVVPLRYGAGIKGKVIEAMYHGIPTVTTSIGMEGIPNENDAVKIVDGEEDFAEAVIELYQSDEILAQMSVSGQNTIKKFYSREAAWNNIAEDFS